MAEGAEGRLAHCERRHKIGRFSENHRGARRFCPLVVQTSVCWVETCQKPRRLSLRSNALAHARGSVSALVSPALLDQTGEEGSANA